MQWTYACINLNGEITLKHLVLACLIFHWVLSFYIIKKYQRFLKFVNLYISQLFYLFSKFTDKWDFFCLFGIFIYNFFFQILQFLFAKYLEVVCSTTKKIVDSIFLMIVLYGYRSKLWVSWVLFIQRQTGNLAT